MVSGFYLFRLSDVWVHPQFRVYSILVSHAIIFVEYLESHDFKVRSFGRGDENTCFPLMWPGFDSQIQLTCTLYLLVFFSAPLVKV